MLGTTLAFWIALVDSLESCMVTAGHFTGVHWAIFLLDMCTQLLGMKFGSDCFSGYEQSVIHSQLWERATPPDSVHAEPGSIEAWISAALRNHAPVLHSREETVLGRHHAEGV